MDKPHKKLDVWNLSMDLARTIYRVTARYPSDEKFGLVSQMRRAAVSIPSNLAEGAARSSDNEFVKLSLYFQEFAQRARHAIGFVVSAWFHHGES